MTDFDKSFTKAITEKLKIRLGRDLNSLEIEAFTRIRSGIAYEMMMDYISDAKKDKTEIEKYVSSVVEENKK
ncbi:MAG: hypothetical protein R2753_15405 [Chitinophagales bacterium]